MRGNCNYFPGSQDVPQGTADSTSHTGLILPLLVAGCCCTGCWLCTHFSSHIVYSAVISHSIAHCQPPASSWGTERVPCRVILATHSLTASSNVLYTVSQKKLGPFYFYCNFGKCWSIFKILSMSESERNGS